MSFRSLVPAGVLLLVVSACSGSTAESSTTVATTTTTSTTLVTTTSSTEPPATTEASTTTTTVPEETTTTTEDSGETTTTTRVPLTTTSTTAPPTDADPDLIPYAGLYRQPTVYNGFLDFQATGVIRAGYAYDDLPIGGRWDYDAAEGDFIFTDFDFGDEGCDGAEGRYHRETAFGGGRRITLVEDPCSARVAFIVQPESECQCFVYLKVTNP